MNDSSVANANIVPPSCVQLQNEPPCSISQEENNQEVPEMGMSKISMHVSSLIDIAKQWWDRHFLSIIA